MPLQYANYSYYTKQFGGDLFTESACFDALAKRASRIVNQYTFGRIEVEELDRRPYGTAVKDCVCMIAEKLETIKRESEESTVSSETVGNRSVTYRADKKRSDQEIETLIYNIVCNQLATTGLLYAGIGRSI